MAKGVAPVNVENQQERLRQAWADLCLRPVIWRVAKLDPLTPSRADYRLIHKLLDSSFAGQVIHTEQAYDLILKVFQHAGGSWERLFMGSSKDIGLLKKVIAVAFKKDHLPKTPQWR